MICDFVRVVFFPLFFFFNGLDKVNFLHSLELKISPEEVWSR